MHLAFRKTYLLRFLMNEFMACACLLFASWSLVLSWCGAAHPDSTPSGACCVGNARRMSKILRQKGLCVAIAGHPGRTPSGACDVGNARFTTCIHTLVHPNCTPSGACKFGQCCKFLGTRAKSQIHEQMHSSASTPCLTVGCSPLTAAQAITIYDATGGI